MSGDWSPWIGSENVCCCSVITVQDDLDEVYEASSPEASAWRDDRGSAEPSQSASPHQRRQPRCGRQQIDMASADRDTRRCRSLSSDRQGHSPARSADDGDLIDGVQPLAPVDASPVYNAAVNTFARSPLSLSVDNVNTSASSNKRKAVATLPGNEQKSHRMSL